MDCEQKLLIARELENCVDDTIKRLNSKSPTSKPFHELLLTEEALNWSRFERSFSTSFGQKSVEKISLAAARIGGATHASRQKNTVINLHSSQSQAVDNHIKNLRNNSLGRSPDWNQDLASLLETPLEGSRLQERVISDIWWKKDNIDNYMSIKTVQPNIDQTAAAKRDLLTLKINDNECNVYFGLYYNPFGNCKTDYSFSPPKNIFNMHTDPVVLIGKEYWDTLGGEDFYEQLLEIFQQVGMKTRETISSF